MLPQFIAVTERSKPLQSVIKDKRKLDRLRRRINEFLWAGKVFDADELVSLKDILEKEDCNTFQDQPEEYIMLSNIVDENYSDDAGGRDLRLLVRRTRINFNK